MSTQPPGFRPVSLMNPFIDRVGVFYVRTEEDGSQALGSWIGHDQSNSQGFAHGGFLLSFADYALSHLTSGIPLNLTANFLRPARVGQWMQARVSVRKASARLIFADAIVSCEDREVLRVSGLLRPIEKREDSVI